MTKVNVETGKGGIPVSTGGVTGEEERGAKEGGESGEIGEKQSMGGNPRQEREKRGEKEEVRFGWH